MHTREIGGIGEDTACRFLTLKGHKVVKRNWTCHFGELDIVTVKDGVTVFVEVKLRRSSSRGYAYESLNYFKKKHLRRSISYYITSNNISFDNWRFDLVCFDKAKITHYENLNIN